MFLIRIFSILFCTVAVVVGGQPTAPTDLAAATDCSGVNLSWSPVSANPALQGYMIYRNGSCIFTNGTTTTYSDTDVSAVNYTYNVSAYNKNGDSPQSAPASVVPCPDTTPPNVPATLTAGMVSCRQVNLSWAQSADAGPKYAVASGVKSYNVYRDGTNPGNLIGQVLAPATSFSDTTVSGGTSYSYSVCAVDNAANSSAFARAVNVTMPASPPAAGPPGKARLSHRGNANVVDWSGATGVLYQAECSADFGQSWEPVDAPTTSFAVTNLITGPWLLYRVSWFTNTDEYRNNFSVYSGDTTPPEPPSDFTASDLPDSQVALAWTPATDSESGLKGYLLYRGDAQDTNTVFLKFVPDGTLAYTDNSGSSDNTYEIAAIDKAGNPSPQARPSCTFGLSPTSWSAPTAGGSTSVTVTARKNCSSTSWTVSNPCSGWLTVTPASGTGSGTVTVTATSNTTGSTRSCTVTIAGQSFAVTQAAGSCTYAIAPASWSAPAGGGSTSVSVTTSSGCSWTVSNPCSSWLTVTPSSGSGSGTVTVTATSNTTGSTRSCTVTIAGKSFAVTQAAGSCTYAIAPASWSAPAGGGSTSVSVTTSSGCSWTVSNPCSSWLTVTPMSGTGNGTVTVTATSNTTGSTRSCTVTIAGQSFAVTQAAGSCTYAITPASWSAPAGGGSTSVSVTTSSGCSWTVSNPCSSWLTVTPSSGTGNGTVTVTATSNTTGSTRSCTVTIAGQSFTVTQPPVPGCAYSLSPTSASFGASSASGNFTVNVVGSGCGWAASTTYGWIHTTSSGSGSGTANYSVDANASTTSRSGAITVTGQNPLTSQNFTVMQAGNANTNSWAIRFGGTGNDGGTAVTDGNGNIIVSGYFQGSVDFGGGALTSAGGYDLVIAKYSSAGAHLWSKRYGGTGDEIVTSIALDASGNIFLGGYYTGTADLGGGSLTNAGQQDAFLAKYSPTGDHLWSQRFGGAYGDIIASVAIDSQGNVIATGFFQGSVTIGGTTLSSKYNAVDTFLAKFSPTGASVWPAKGFNNTSYNVGTGVHVDKNDNILLTGYTSFSVDFGGGIIQSNGDNIYLAKFLSTGDYIWQQVYGAGAARAWASTIDTNGDVAVCGDFRAQTDLGGGVITGTAAEGDVFVAKYSGTDGSWLWSRGIVGNYGAEANSVTADAQNNILVTGYYYGTYNFGSNTLSSVVNSYDIYVAKYSSAGTPVWAKTFGGTGTDAGNSVAVDSTGHPVVTGYFQGNASFAGQSLTSAGGYDGFLLRLNPNP